jgi:hypothetical protein
MATRTVSTTAANGTPQANGSSSSYVAPHTIISGDGRYVVFQSNATNFNYEDANRTFLDIFRKDLTTGELARVNQTALGVQANLSSSGAAISADSRYVVFQSQATNLASDANSSSFDIFRKDLENGELVRVNDTAAGVQANNSSTGAAISADGRYVTFQSNTTNLAGTDANGTTLDIFRKDLTTGELVRVNDTAAGVQANGASSNATIAADGRYVVFQSQATNLAGTDANGTNTDIFRKDLTTGEVVRVNDTAGGVQGNGSSINATISDNGRYVTFQSSASNLVGGDDNNTSDVFVKDMVTGAIARVSNADGTTNAANGASVSPSISGDGSRIAFQSTATNLVAGDGNGQQDVFVADNPVCFVEGSAIRVVRDGAVRDVAVEALRVGDLAVTTSGAHRPIRWIGHRRLDCARHPDPAKVRPVRIAAGAFGEGRPSRDLRVSAAHAIAVDILGAVLIPACRLINGTTITQEAVESVTYWHVELDEHDILLAENLPAESYLDCGNRRFFANADATDLMAAPDTRPEGPLPFCRPFHEDGPLVDLVRARLRERAEALGWHRVEETFAGLYLVADGSVIQPDVEGLTARFVLPAEARDVRLVCAVSVPAHVVTGSTDARRLGVSLAALTIDDGLTGARAVALDDARLDEGFHAFDRGARWSDGSAVLPASLWAGCQGTVFLRIRLSGPALPRWIGVAETACSIERAGCRKRA